MRLDALFLDQPPQVRCGAIGGVRNEPLSGAALSEEAMKYCLELGVRARSGLSEMKRLARTGAEMPLTDALQLECDAVVHHLQGTDAAEGIAAFRERRKPSFK